MGFLSSDVSFTNIKPKDVLTFTNSLYILKKSKFNNVAAFESLFNSTQNPKLQDIVEDILIGIESGSTILYLPSIISPRATVTGFSVERFFSSRFSIAISLIVVAKTYLFIS